MLQAPDPGVPTGHLPRTVELVRQHGGKDVVDQRRLARPGHAGDRHQATQREGHVDLAQVVLARAHHRQLPLAVAHPPLRGQRNLLSPRQVIPGQRLLVLQQLLVGAAVHDLAAVLARAGPDVDHPVRAAHGVLVMLDDDQRIAQISQSAERFQQPVVVPLVQPDRRLVQHVEHADETRTDLGGQPDALRLATGQRPGRAVQRQVVQPDVEQEAQPRLHFLEHPPGDHLLALAEHQPVQELGALVHAQRADLGDGQLAEFVVLHCHGKDLGLEPSAVTCGARHVPHVALVLLAGVVGLGLLQPPLQERDDTLVGGVVGAGPPVAVLVPDVHLVVGAVQHGLLDLGGQPLPRGVHVEADGLRQRGQQPGEVLRGMPTRPRRDRAFGQRQILVGHDQLGVDLLADAQTHALGARAVGRVERE